MTVESPLVIVTRKLPEAVETRLMELFDAQFNPKTTAWPAPSWSNGKTADVLVPTVTTGSTAAC